ncbi:MAG: hypothetical protein ACYDCS_14975 [Candidatus Dormibacteria bacterium]
MSDIERDLEDLGRRVWPTPEHVRRRVMSGDGARPPVSWRRVGRPLGALLGTGAAIVLIGGASAAGIVALQQHLSVKAPGTGHNGAAAGVPSGSSGSNSGQGNAAAGSIPAPSDRVSPAPQLALSPTPSPHITPAAGPLTITGVSRGTFEVIVGTTIEVDLPGSTLDAWGVPSSTSAQIVRFERGSRVSGGGFSATFVAAASGEATIQAVQSPHCPPLCGPPSFFWHVEVIVVA